MRQMENSALGVQIGPFAAFWAHFVLIIFKLFHFHTGEPNSITPGGQSSENGILPTSELRRQMKTSGWGILTKSFAVHREAHPKS